MPFIKPEQRIKVDKTGAWEAPGDLTYMKYKPLMEAWRKERRWTTAHNLTKEMFDIDDEKCAKLMAWFVFMADEVMDYERRKKEENGEV